MSKTRNVQVPQVVRDGADDLSITFYVSDALSGSQPRVIVHFPTSGPISIDTDRPLSDYSTLSGAQKTNLRTLLTAIRDQAFSLEGFS